MAADPAVLSPLPSLVPNVVWGSLSSVNQASEGTRNYSYYYFYFALVVYIATCTVSGAICHGIYRCIGPLTNMATSFMTRGQIDLCVG